MPAISHLSGRTRTIVVGQPQSKLRTSVENELGIAARPSYDCRSAPRASSLSRRSASNAAFGTRFRRPILTDFRIPPGSAHRCRCGLFSAVLRLLLRLAHLVQYRASSSGPPNVFRHQTCEHLVSGGLQRTDHYHADSDKGTARHCGVRAGFVVYDPKSNSRPSALYATKRSARSSPRPARPTQSVEAKDELVKALKLRFLAPRPLLDFWDRYAISMCCGDTHGGAQSGSIVPVDEVGQSIPDGVLRRKHVQ